MVGLVTAAVVVRLRCRACTAGSVVRGRAALGEVVRDRPASARARVHGPARPGRRPAHTPRPDPSAVEMHFGPVEAGQLVRAFVERQEQPGGVEPGLGPALGDIVFGVSPPCSGCQANAALLTRSSSASSAGALVGAQFDARRDHCRRQVDAASGASATAPAPACRPNAAAVARAGCEIAVRPDAGGVAGSSASAAFTIAVPTPRRRASGATTVLPSEVPGGSGRAGSGSRRRLVVVVVRSAEQVRCSPQRQFAQHLLGDRRDAVRARGRGDQLADLVLIVWRRLGCQAIACHGVCEADQ